MHCTMRTPFLNAIVISSDGHEHVMVRSVMSINRVHYVIFIPLVTAAPEEQPEDAWVEDWEGWEDPEEGLEIEPVAFGRLRYDYARLRAHIEPITWDDEPETIDRILLALQRLYS